MTGKRHVERCHRFTRSIAHFADKKIVAGKKTFLKRRTGDDIILKKIEINNYGIRKNLLDYDQVNNDQREVDH